MSNIKIKRGRKPGSGVMRFKPVVSTMADFTYDKSLFTPMPTGKKIEGIFSDLNDQGGLILSHNKEKSVFYAAEIIEELKIV